MHKTRVLMSVIVALALVSTSAFARQGRVFDRPRGGGAYGPSESVPQAMQDLANNVVGLVNSGDYDGLAAIAADDLVFLDEDGHRMPRAIMLDRLTSGPKQMAISNMQGQLWDNVGWVSFNFTMEETFVGQRVTLRGTASMVAREVDGRWMLAMVHTALEQHPDAFLDGN